MKSCPLCRWSTANEEDRYCYVDGHYLVASAVCECGKFLTPHDRYCSKCGKKAEHRAVA